jgi:hypothetical protein
MDDRVAEEVLRQAITGGSSQDPTVQWALEVVAVVRQHRPDASDSLWRDALRVIYASLKRHSSCKIGETNYLDFTAQFVR